MPDVILIGTKAWEKLSEEEKQWVQEAAEASSQAQKEYWRMSVEASMKKAREAGVEIIIPDKPLFANKTKTVLEDFQMNFPELAKLVDEIKAN